MPRFTPELPGLGKLTFLVLPVTCLRACGICIGPPLAPLEFGQLTSAAITLPGDVQPGVSRPTWQGHSLHCWKVPESPAPAPALPSASSCSGSHLAHFLQVVSMGPLPERLPQAPKEPLCFVSLGAGKGMCWVGSTWELFYLQRQL